jgi:hypothetical protein
LYYERNFPCHFSDVVVVVRRGRRRRRMRTTTTTTPVPAVMCQEQNYKKPFHNFLLE